MSLTTRIIWSLRRVRIQIDKKALVLEVGSGGNPYPRANVLVDAYEQTRERFWAPLVHDRPTVLSFGESLPFKDKVFDFVIASHVLEHTPYPEKFLSELQRVAKAGYIETPDAFMERINPYKDHKLEVTKRNGQLLIRKKASWIGDPDLVELYEDRAKRIITRETIPRHAEQFHLRYFWKNKIDFLVINPEVDASWSPPLDTRELSTHSISAVGLVRAIFLRLLRRIFSQNSRNATLDIVPLMRCPKCGCGDLSGHSDSYVACADCDSQYEVRGNIIVFSTSSVA